MSLSRARPPSEASDLDLGLVEHFEASQEGTLFFFRLPSTADEAVWVKVVPWDGGEALVPLEHLLLFIRHYEEMLGRAVAPGAQLGENDL